VNSFNELFRLQSTKASSTVLANTCAATCTPIPLKVISQSSSVYQHCAEKHLHRYLAEFDFRYNNRIALGVNDGERATLAMKGIEGKRLTYRPAR
jgi:hypothetical protein